MRRGLRVDQNLFQISDGNGMFICVDFAGCSGRDLTVETCFKKHFDGTIEFISSNIIGRVFSEEEKQEKIKEYEKLCNKELKESN